MWELFQMHYQVLTISYTSLASYLVLVLIHWLWADTPSYLKKTIVSLVASFCHSCAAFSVVVGFEAMFQAATDRYLSIYIYRYVPDNETANNI